MADEPAAPAPKLKSFVSIAELQPSCSSTKAIRSVVALLWPYSTSKKSLTLLLAEPDFRLRRKNGQVRVEFHGSSAKAVARSGLCTGDEVVLSLEGAGWSRDEAEVRTAGKGVDWKLTFGERVRVQITRDSQQLASLNIDYPNSSPEPRPISITPSSSPTPRTAEPSSSLKFKAKPESNIWQSPAFLKRARTSSSSFFDNLYDAFAEDGVDKPAKRSKYGRHSGQWRYAETMPIPQDNADLSSPSHAMGEVVDIEAELELARAGETADSPASSVGELDGARTNRLAITVMGAHPVRSEGTQTPETEEGGTLVEAESLSNPSRDAMMEKTDFREGTTSGMAEDQSSVQIPPTYSYPPVHEVSSEPMYREEQPSADTETAFLRFHENTRAIPVLPNSPRLSPITPLGLPLVSPFMSRREVSSSINEEQKYQRHGLGLDTEDVRLGGLSTTHSISEISDYDEHAAWQSTEVDQEMKQIDLYHRSLLQSENTQASEGRRHDLDGTLTSHRTARDQSEISVESTDLIHETLQSPISYVRSCLPILRSKSRSSGASASEKDIGDGDELSEEDLEGFATDEISSENPTDGTESATERELLGRASSEEEQPRQTNEDMHLLGHNQSYDEKEGNDGNVKPLGMQTSEIIDLEDGSEEESHSEAISLDVQSTEEVVSSPTSGPSPSDDGSLDSDYDLHSSNADSIYENEASEYIAYPTLPVEQNEQPPASDLRLPRESQNAETRPGPQQQTQLITPHATQQTQRKWTVSFQSSYQDYSLPTPQLTQSASTGLMSLDLANSVGYKASSRHEQRRSTAAVARGMKVRTSSVPEAIGTYFTLKRHGHLYEEGEKEDDESDSQSEQSLDSELQDNSHTAVDRDGYNELHHAISQLATDTSNVNGQRTTLSPHVAPPPPGLRTSLSYFVPLAAIQDYFASTIDVLAVITSTTSPKRSNSGSRDYHLNLNIADPSLNSSFISVHLFRPFKEALPVASQGAPVLLRNFKVQSQKQKFILVSTVSSAWAVFEQGQSVQVNGPPVEIGAEERGFAKGLSQWWASLGQNIRVKNGDDQRLGGNDD